MIKTAVIYPPSGSVQRFDVGTANVTSIDWSGGKTPLLFINFANGDRCVYGNMPFSINQTAPY